MPAKKRKKKSSGTHTVKKSKRKAKKSSMKGGKKVSTAKFAGMTFVCKGKKVRAGKKKTKVARVFCARKA